MKKLTELDLNKLRNTISFEAIDRDFAIITDISMISFFEYPTKLHVAATITCLKGRMEMSIDLKRYVVTENQIVTIRPDQILQYHNISDDFTGRFAVMSKDFMSDLKITVGERYPYYIFLRDNPVLQCSQQEIDLCNEYYVLIDKAIKMSDNPNKKETVKYLTLALFFALNTISLRHQDLKPKPYSRKDTIFGEFYKLIRQHHKEHRTVAFYADLLCLTPKYLTTVIREVSGKTAHNWINEYVVLSAKAMLKSTTMTVQEISNELSFANQSFFGKYFRQCVGMSPGEYRKSN